MYKPLHRIMMMAFAFPAALARIAPSNGYRTQAYNPYQKPVYAKRTSRYMPHQGEREMARRRRQMGET